MRRPQYAREDDRPARRKTKKNTRKWCKGTPGRLHLYTWKLDNSFMGYTWNRDHSRRYIKSCDLCGKHSVKHYGFSIICVESERDRQWVESRMAGKWDWSSF